ncbi:site-specific integrase [Bradyrhizobium sp. SYSU BS000235]|uniref:site-specific integrase n=1 Tax=Bradyrhizobium sp. SYSU BS000235 TaxID=3411332 RepID=UPI003C756CE7
MKPASEQKRDSEAIATIISLAKAVPHPPSTVRYYDDFTDEYRSITNFPALPKIQVHLDGLRQTIKIEFFGIASPILRLILAHWLPRKDTSSVFTAFSALEKFVANHGISALSVLIASSAREVHRYWNSYVRVHALEHADFLRLMLHALCSHSIGSWMPEDVPLLRRLKGPKKDQYKTVREGECFLPIDDQTAIITYLDDMCERVIASPEAVSSYNVWSACIIALCFQYGFRPGQIARIDTADLRIFREEIVHVSVVIIKQHDIKKKTRVTRRIKREWVSLFIELLKRRTGSHDHPNNIRAPERRLFKLIPNEVSLMVLRTCAGLTGTSWSANDLRHTAAQRLADAGVASVVISEFLNHTRSRTALQYHWASPAQALIVNQALAISEIYSRVAKVAKERTIDSAALHDAPPEEQIGGVPHGIPITGIGRCEVGQRTCTKNPVLSCYTCRRFMPVSEPAIHEQVLNDLRPMVVEFAKSSRGNQKSPAYVQLRSTLDSIRRLTESLKIEKNS